MEENVQENKYIVFIKRILPTVIRITTIIIYTIFNFIKTSIRYIIDQLRNN